MNAAPSIEEAPEEWREIPGYPDHLASSHGRVRHKLHLLKPWKATASGRLVVSIRRPRYTTTAMVARLVGRAFSPDFAEDRWSRFSDGNSDNCRPDNIEWVEPRELAAGPVGTKQGRHRLTEAQVREIREIHHLHPGTRQSDLAHTYGVAKDTICKIIHRHTWKHLDP